MSKGKILKELESPISGGSRCLYVLNGEYYSISSIPSAPDHGLPETLAFKADKTGKVLDWADLAGGRLKTREDTITQLEEEGENPFKCGTSHEEAMSVILNPPDENYYA